MKNPLKIFHILALLVIISVTSLSPQKSYAYCCGCEACVASQVDHTLTDMQIIMNFSQGFSDTLTWITSTLWMENIYPALISMSMEFTAVALTNQASIGSMLDGVTMNKRIAGIQEMQARTARDQTPSVSMCKYASLSKSLAASNEKSRLASSYLSKRSMERQVGGKREQNTGATNNQETAATVVDHKTRFGQFLAYYCDPGDFQNGLGAHPQCAGTRPNADINYNALVDTRLTLNIDFSDNFVNEDELDIMAMSNNLFADELPERVVDQFNTTGKRGQYMKYRSLMAKRNVAEHSFNTLVGLRSAGSDSSFEVMRGLMYELIPDDPSFSRDPVIARYLRPFPNADSIQPQPSYYAQMEFLTQKVFQNPAFFANLYDGPANVERQYAALQALGLMQRREAFESMTRSELLTSVLLSMEVDDVMQ